MIKTIEVMKTKRELNKPTRYKNCRIEETPLGKYPEMVTIVRTPAKYKSIKNKKYLNMEKCKIAIDLQVATSLINKGGMRSAKDLETLGLGSLMNY